MDGHSLLCLSPLSVCSFDSIVIRVFALSTDHINLPAEHTDYLTLHNYLVSLGKEVTRLIIHPLTTNQHTCITHI